MSIHRCGRALAAIALLTMSIGPTMASEPDAARAARLEKAQAILDLATVEFRAGRHAAALAELQQAEPLLDGSPVHPLVRFNIARCHEELGQLGDAVRAYRRYIELADPDADRQARAKAAIETLEPKARGALKVACSAPGARVTIPELLPDGADCPVEIEALAGQYRIQAAVGPFAPTTETVRIEPGQTATVQLQVEAGPAEDPLTAPAPAAVDDGPGWMPWALMGVGAASALTGGILHAGATTPCTNQDVDIYENDVFVGTERECIAEPGAEPEVPTAAYAAYGIGGALLVAGVVWLLLDDGPDPQAMIIPTGNGIRVRF